MRSCKRYWQYTSPVIRKKRNKVCINQCTTNENYNIIFFRINSSNYSPYWIKQPYQYFLVECHYHYYMFRLIVLSLILLIIIIAS